MALFQKKPQVTTAAPLYTIGLQRSILIVGLGNPGKKYVGTRHNIGFEIVDNFCKTNGSPKWNSKKTLKSVLAEGVVGANRVILCKPTTYMNLSGESVRAVQGFYKIPNQLTLVVYDELSIPFGQLRTRRGGSDAGHNGVKSLIAHIGEDFNRLRVGIGSDESKEVDPAKFVLKKFSKEERRDQDIIIKEASAMITEFIFNGKLTAETRTLI